MIQMMVILMAICESHVMMIMMMNQVCEMLMMMMTIMIMIIMTIMMMNQVCEMLREKRVAASNRFSFDDLFWLVF